MFDENAQKRIVEILEDESVLEELAAADSDEALSELLNGQGISLDNADIETICAKLNHIKESDELSEEDLEDAAGGCVLCAVAMIGSAIIAGYIVFKVGKWIIDKKYGKT